MTTKAEIKRAMWAAEAALARLDAAGDEELKAIYRQAAEQLRAIIGNHMGGDGNIALQDLRALLDQVEAILARLAADRTLLIDTGLTEAAKLGASASGLDSAAAVRVVEGALQAVRTFTAADGLQLSDRLWRLDRGAREAVTQAIELAVIQGHGSAQAAREFLSQGKQVPPEVAIRVGAGNGLKLGNQAAQLLTGEAGALAQANRVFRTEINRAHGLARLAGWQDNPDIVGCRFELSPRHPKPDICDLFAVQNLYGLGSGGYPKDKILDYWPAHPNTLSFFTAIFADEVTDADRAGKETPMQALTRLAPETREGVLGKGKAALYDEGKIRQGMIRAPLKDVLARAGESAPPAAPKPATSPDKSRREAVAYVLENGRREANGRIEFAMIYDGETGTVLTRKRGGRSHVSFSAGDMQRWSGRPAVAVHNHPGGLSLSEADLRIAAGHLAGGIWAIANDGAAEYFAKVAGDWAPLHSALKAAEQAVYSALQAAITAGEMTTDEAGQVHHHLLNSALAAAGFIDYKATGSRIEAIGSRFDAIIQEAARAANRNKSRRS